MKVAACLVASVVASVVASAVALAVASMALVAQPRPTGTGAPTHARATMQAVAVTASSATLLVTLAVDDGWHVSWRNPGDTGLPTRFAWSLPAGVRIRRETWPVPVVSRSVVGVAHTLEGEVPWLVEFALATADADDRLVGLTLRYGICRDVCIPEQQTIQGVLPGRGAGAAPVVAVPRPLRQRLAADVRPVPARVRVTTGLCLERLPASLTGKSLDLIAGPDRNLDAALPVSRGNGTTTGAAIVRLPASARLGAIVDTVLLVAGPAGVTVPLDFRAPAPHCRR